MFIGTSRVVSEITDGKFSVLYLNLQQGFLVEALTVTWKMLLGGEGRKVILTRILARTPSSLDSMVTTALSVSISHKASPAATGSPGHTHTIIQHKMSDEK